MTDEKNILDLEALQEQLQALDDADLDLIDGGKLSGGAIAGIATAAALATAAIIGIPTALHFKNKPKPAALEQDPDIDTNIPSVKGERNYYKVGDNAFGGKVEEAVHEEPNSKKPFMDPNYNA